MSTRTVPPKTGALYRCPLRIDHSRVGNIDLRDFPVFVQARHASWRRIDAGGHVALPEGQDLFFTAADGVTRLAHELIAYDAEQGQVEAWVKIPQVTCRQDQVFYLHYGGAPATPSGSVWDETYAVVETDCSEVPIPMAAESGPTETEALTVEAWVQASGSGAEAMQPLVSQWAVLESFGRFGAYDAGTTDHLACVGYYGAVFDGRYVYWCPIRTHMDRATVHAHILRYDTQGDFYDPHSWEAYNAAGTDGLNTVCYYGAAFDGRYVVFTPRDDSMGYHSRVMRYDTHKGFKHSDSWEAFDVGLAHSHQGAAFDGRYIYFCPGYAGAADTPLNENALSGKVLRLDTQAPFKQRASYQVFDTQALGGEALCFDGGAFDGRYIYLVPLTTGVVARYDTRGDFGDTASWHTYDARPLGMRMNVGAVFDGRYLYFCAYSHSHMVRYDTRGDFGDEGAWQVFDAAATSGLDTGGFDGGFFDGRFVYFVPWTRTVEPGQDKTTHHCHFLRYDTRCAFDQPDSWDAYDASATDGLRTIGYNAGAFDGRYFYGAPLYEGTGGAFHGRVLRCDTTGDQASFSLRYSDYGHNGGLCAAVPGPSFLVNTTRGVLGIAAHQALNPGWHYLAGVYNGRSLKLFVDGRLVAERAGSGPVQASTAPVSIGGLANGTVRFQGRVEGVRVGRAARSDDWLKAAYRNLADPSGFVRLGQEEVAG